MRALIGLGNPGAEYTETRHNVGFMVLDAVAELLQTRFHTIVDAYTVAERTLRGQKIVLVKPLTYMNNSGLAIAGVLRDYGIDVDKLLIIVDDFHLPLGTVRIRHRGSDGGHNGLRSIIQHLQTTEFARMRCGIGGTSMPNIKSDLASYVLTPFEANELRTVRHLIEQARDAAIETALTNIETAMQRYNTKELNSPYL